MNVTALTRPRISPDFIRQHQRRRLLDATARCIVRDGYRSTTVAAIVKEARVARNTFYDNFASKAAVAESLVSSVIGGLPEWVRTHAFPLAIDLTAPFRIGGQKVAGHIAVEVARAALSERFELDALEDGEDDPYLSTLPPGRHGLPRPFVGENQRRRLIVGIARAVHQKGYAAATIADVARHAAVSRRTFYEHFTGIEELTLAMMEEAEARSGVVLGDYDLDRGLNQLWAEIVAAGFCGDAIVAAERREAGLELVERCRNLEPQELAA